MSEGLLKGLTARTRELGRLRTGDSVPVTDKNGQIAKRDDGSTKMRPNKRTTWRITSPSRYLLDQCAEQYGGTVAEWTDAPTPGQWELSTDKESLEVMIPTNDTALSQAFELWSGDGCARRCDGERMSDDSACLCPADIEARMAGAAAKTPTACKPTTRLNVLLPDIPELGYWRLECHGYNAAVEIPGQLALARGLATSYADPSPYFLAFLRIEARVSKRNGETRRFTVPVIEIPTSGRALLARSQIERGPATALDEGGHSTALEAGEAQPQEAHPPSPAAPPPSDDPFDAFVSETWIGAFNERCADTGLDAAAVSEIVMAGTASRTGIVGQIHKSESGAVKAALARWLESPATGEAVPA